MAEDSTLRSVLSHEWSSERRPQSIALDLSQPFYRFLADHCVDRVSLLAGSVTIELALAAAIRLSSPAAFALRAVQFHQPLALSDSAIRALQVNLAPTSFGWRLELDSEGQCVSSVELHSLDNGAASIEAASSEVEKLAAHSPSEFYASLAERGNQYGVAFQVFEELHCGENRAAGVLRSLANIGLHPDNFAIHPAHIDGAIQMVAAAAGRSDGPYLLRGIDRVQIGDLDGLAQRCHAVVTAHDGSSVVTGTVVIEDERSRAMLRLEGVELVYRQVDDNTTRIAVDREELVQLAVAATFTADPVAEIVQFWGRQLNLPLHCEIAPYNQISQQLLDPESLFAKNTGGANVILIRYADWVRENQPKALVSSGERRKELLSGRASYQLSSGMEIAHLHDYETEYVYQEIFSDGCYVKHGISLDDCQCIIDIGANIGLFSLFALQHCPDARVLAFEPSPEAFEALRINGELYGGGRLKPFNCGVSDGDGTASFTFYEQSSVFSTFHADLEDDESAVAAVVANMVRTSLGTDASEDRVQDMVDQLMSDRMRSRTLDCQLRGLSSVLNEEGVDRIDLLKLDAEKSELKILRGIAAEHWKKIRQIVIEVHDKVGDVIEAVERLLEEKGFEVAIEEETLLQGSGLYNIFGVRPASVATMSNQRADVVGDVQARVSQRAVELATQIRAALSQRKTPLFVLSCPSPDLPGFSTSAADAELKALLADTAGVTFRGVDDSALVHRYAITKTHDLAAESLGHVPYTEDYFAALGTSIARLWYTSTCTPKKVIVLDCDNTLWGGVCGEVEPSELVIDEPRRRLQQFMVEQSRAGRLLCLCSKNELADVEAVFGRRPDMPLKREHIVGWKVNWTAKSKNLRRLADELSLGLGSFVFVDDNPVECAEVAASLPEVATIQLPESSEEIPTWLEHIWDFDVTSVTDEDQTRTRLYQEQRERNQLREHAPTLAEFISSLELRVDIKQMSAVDVPRVSQLTQRTNQFNVSTIRRTEADVRRLGGDGVQTWTVRVADRFGDYGLVGVATCRNNETQLLVDSMMLSCRVLGRGVEHQVLAHLGRIAREAALQEVVIDFRPSERNQPARDFLESLDGFRKVDGDPTVYRIDAALALEARYEPKEVAAQQSSGSDHDASIATSKTVGPRIVNAAEWRTAASIREAASRRQFRLRPETLGTLVSPANETESMIAEVWQEVLRIDRVGVTDSYKELGGTSLLAVQIVARLQERLRRDLSIVSFFEYPMIRQFAKHLVNDARDRSQESVDNATERAQRRRQARGRRRPR